MITDIFKTLNSHFMEPTVISEQTEGNKLIAEFMGGNDYLRKTHLRGLEWYEMEQVTDDQILFDTSWGWLMPVVEKIKSLENRRFDVEMSHHSITVIDYKMAEIDVVVIDRYENEEFIEMVWDCVVAFIKWYKENNKQHETI